MKKLVGDLSGKKFGDWTVIRMFNKVEYTKYWLCRCSCGIEKPVVQQNLTRGLSHSCGSIERHKIIRRNTEFLEQYRKSYENNEITVKQLLKITKLSHETFKKHCKEYNWYNARAKKETVKFTAKDIIQYKDDYESARISICGIHRITKISLHLITKAIRHLGWKKPDVKIYTKPTIIQQQNNYKINTSLTMLESQTIEKFFYERVGNSNLSNGRHYISIDGYRIKFDINKGTIKKLVRYKTVDGVGVTKYDFGKYGYRYLFNNYTNEAIREMEAILSKKTAG